VLLLSKREKIKTEIHLFVSKNGLISEGGRTIKYENTKVKVVYVSVCCI